MNIIEAAEALELGKVVESVTRGGKLRVIGFGKEQPIFNAGTDNSRFLNTFAGFNVADLLATDYEVVE